MAADPVAIVRRWGEVVGGWLESDGAAAELADAVAELVAGEEFEFHAVPKSPDPGPFRGAGGFASYMARFRETWSWRFSIEELLPAGDGRVLARIAVRIEGRASGIAQAGEYYECYWLRGERILRVEDHTTVGGALRAFGLEGDTLDTLPR